MLPPQIYEFGYYVEMKVQNAFDVMADVSDKTWQVTKGAAKGAYNILESMTMAGQAGNTVVNLNEYNQKDAWERHLGFNPKKSYEAIKDVYKYGSLEEKAQVTTELIGTGVLLFEGARQTTGVTTPYTKAVQSVGKASLEARSSVKSGTTLYRLGTEGVSKTGAEAQFWALENPLDNPAAFAKKYNIPLKNIENADFIETAVLKEGANFITRPAGKAPGMDPNGGGGIEAVIDMGGTTNNVITPIKK